MLNKELQLKIAKLLMEESLLTPEKEAEYISAITALTEQLFPLSTIITPNIPEAEVLSGITITSENDMFSCAEYIGNKYHCQK